MTTGPMRTQKPLEDLALALEARQLAGPAIIALELFKPLGFVASQLLFLTEPLLGDWGGHARRYAALMEDRGHIDALLSILTSRRSSRLVGGTKCGR